ncbi:hypothetical protein KR009_004125 [Drosophila setifemur]|nr:hypothetical protein KR009_004125 [Drosophila setifemur]
MADFYELLKVPANATFEEIKCSYKQLILQCHPDKLQQLDDPNPRAETQNSDFNAINTAWNTLKDPIKRKHYDAEMLQSKFQTHSNIYAHVELSEMQRVQVEIEGEGEADESPESESADKGSETMWSYAYDCRCGGQYLFDGPGDDDDDSPATISVSAPSSSHSTSAQSSEVIVECSECSLVIIVKQTAKHK